MELEEHLETTVKAHDQLLHRRVDLLLRTGKVLVESLADTNRIVRNMKRTAAYLGIPEEKLHINVSFTMLMVNVSDGDYSFTKFQRIEGHGVNMTAISEISKLSWRAIENDYSLTSMRKSWKRFVPRSAITLLGRWPSERVLHAADFAFSSAATGWPFCMLQSLPFWECVFVRSATSPV